MTDSAPSQSAESAATGPEPPTSRVRWVAMFLGAGALGLAALTAKMSRQKRHLQEYIVARDTIDERTRSLIYLPAVLDLAARQPELSPGNAQLGACLGGQGTCTATSPEQQVAFALRLSLGPEAPLMVGTAEHPAHYSGTGKVGCEPGRDEACPGWTVQAWFWADCPEQAPRCAKATRLHVRHQVVPLGELAALPATPDAAALGAEPTAFAQTVELGP